MRNVINETAEFIKQNLPPGDPGHDWWHIYRVWQNAKVISQSEGGNSLIIELAALLHDIDDHKFKDNLKEPLLPKVKGHFEVLKLDQKIQDSVFNIIKEIKYTGPKGTDISQSLEHAIVLDADRLDAIGAIGIARAFSYGGFKQRPFWNPDIRPDMDMKIEEYRKSESATIDHFYEKLLLLKDRMLTPTGKRLAEKKHDFMVLFLEQFFAEWDGGEKTSFNAESSLAE